MKSTWLKARFSGVMCTFQTPVNLAPNAKMAARAVRQAPGRRVSASTVIRAQCVKQQVRAGHSSVAGDYRAAVNTSSNKHVPNAYKLLCTGLSIYPLSRVLLLEMRS